MAGTINLAFTQQFDMDGAPLSGGLLYFFTAGTTTPQSAFQDTGLTLAHPNPIVLDASGRVPMFYLSDGFIKIRLTDKNGVTIIAADQLLVIGPSGGTTSSSTTPGDTTSFLATGDIKARYDTGVKDGFVRCNGLTIGNTGSSATERADPATQPLFVYLWSFSNISLEGFAKGANALADFNAGRRLLLPDLRGRTLAGLDDMGNPTPAGRLTSTYFGSSGTVLGNAGGSQSHTLTLQQSASHSHTLNSGATGIESRSHTHTGGTGVAGTGAADGAHEHGYTLFDRAAGLGAYPLTGSTGHEAAATTTGGDAHSHNVLLNDASQTHTHTLTDTSTDSQGSGLAHNNVQPSFVLTFYMKM